MSSWPLPVMMQRFTDWHPLGDKQACVARNDCKPVNSSEDDLFTLQHEWRGSSAHRHGTLMSVEQNRSRSDRWVLQDQQCVYTSQGQDRPPPHSETATFSSLVPGSLMNYKAQQKYEEHLLLPLFRKIKK